MGVKLTINNAQKILTKKITTFKGRINEIFIYEFCFLAYIKL